MHLRISLKSIVVVKKEKQIRASLGPFPVYKYNGMTYAAHLARAKKLTLHVYGYTF